jgi:hypothetical protein
MSTVEEFSEQELSDAQWALDHYPSGSTYWDSHSAQDHLEVMLKAGLKPATTEQWRLEWHREQVRRARLEDCCD